MARQGGRIRPTISPLRDLWFKFKFQAACRQEFELAYIQLPRRVLPVEVISCLLRQRESIPDPFELLKCYGFPTQAGWQIDLNSPFREPQGLTTLRNSDQIDSVTPACLAIALATAGVLCET